MPWYKERFAMVFHKWYFSVWETELEELHLIHILL
jgi:hypothetical protein